MNKQEIRALIRQRKKQHTPAELSALSLRLTATLLDRIEALSAHKNKGEASNTHASPFSAQESIITSTPSTILLYHSLPDEVDTHQLIRTLHSIGKLVLLPTIKGEELELHEYTDENALAPSFQFNIQESTGRLYTDYHLIDLAIIPGMAFTPSGDRLGRGKGYYDRLLPKLSCPLIGLAFPFQILDTLPCEPHDIRMTEVIY